MTDFVLADETHCVRKMIAELQANPHLLSPWERKFIQTLLNWTGNFTQGQSETAVRMWGKHAKNEPKMGGPTQ